MDDLACAQPVKGRLDAGNRWHADDSDTAQGTGRAVADSPLLRHGEAARLFEIDYPEWTQLRADELTDGFAGDDGH